jgi:hypothetical protein
MSAESLVLHLQKALANAEIGASKITQDIVLMEGMTGTKTRHFYNGLLNMEDARYLEIGTWKGSSVCAAMCGNSAHVTCIDNWTQFGGPKNEFLANFDKHKGSNTATFIEGDCWSIDLASLPKFNIYMFDGNHSVEDQFKALVHYIDRLDDTFIYVVDDWNVNEVRVGTMAAISELGLDVKWSHEIRLTYDNTHTPQPLAALSWWNGIYMAVLSKKKA